MTDWKSYNFPPINYIIHTLALFADHPHRPGVNYIIFYRWAVTVLSKYNPTFTRERNAI